MVASPLTADDRSPGARLMRHRRPLPPSGAPGVFRPRMLARENTGAGRPRALKVSLSGGCQSQAYGPAHAEPPTRTARRGRPAIPQTALVGDRHPTGCRVRSVHQNAVPTDQVGLSRRRRRAPRVSASSRTSFRHRTTARRHPNETRETARLPGSCVLSQWDAGEDESSAPDGAGEDTVST